MKKFLIAVAAVFVATSVNAQKESYMPEQGDFGVEIGFNPFSNNYNTFDLINGVKVRYFLSDADALRLNVGFNVDGDKNTTELASKEYVSHWRRGQFSLNLGYERHFNMTNRIDLYAGAQLGIIKNFASAKEEAPDGAGGIMETTYSGADNQGNFASFGFGAGVFTGIDVYLWKGLYCGAELGLRVSSSSENDWEREVKAGTTTTKTKVKGANRNMNGGFYCEPAIRLGWTF